MGGPWTGDTEPEDLVPKARRWAARYREALANPLYPHKAGLSPLADLLEALAGEVEALRASQPPAREPDRCPPSAN